MQKKTLAMMGMIGCAAVLMTGCVKQEEYDAAMAKITERDTKIESLNETIAQRDTDLAAKVSQIEELNATVEGLQELGKDKDAQIVDLQNEVADEQAKVSELEADIESEKDKLSSARDSIRELQSELDAQKEAYIALEARWDQFEKNLEALRKVAPVEGDAQPAVVSDVAPASVEADSVAEGEKSAADMLNEMLEMSK